VRVRVWATCGEGEGGLERVHGGTRQREQSSARPWEIASPCGHDPGQARPETTQRVQGARTVAEASAAAGPTLRALFGGAEAVPRQQWHTREGCWLGLVCCNLGQIVYWAHFSTFVFD